MEKVHLTLPLRPAHLRRQPQKRLHLPADPLVLMVDDLLPDVHVERGHVDPGKEAAVDVRADGEFRQEGDPLPLFEQADDELRVADLQKRPDFQVFRRQILLQQEAVAGAFFGMGFSLLRTSEFFVIRKMEMSETKTHLLCGWSQIVIQKITFPLQ